MNFYQRLRLNTLALDETTVRTFPFFASKTALWTFSDFGLGFGLSFGLCEVDPILSVVFCLAAPAGRGTFAGLFGGGGRFGRGNTLSLEDSGSNSANFSCLVSLSAFVDPTRVSSIFLTWCTGGGRDGLIAGLGGGGLLGWVGRF